MIKESSALKSQKNFDDKVMKESLMKPDYFSNWIVLVLLTVSACSQRPSGTGNCESVGYFESQANCQATNGSADCSMATVQIEGQNKVCWMGSSLPTGLQNIKPNLGSLNLNGCSWVVGAWNPECGGSVNTQTRLVTCNCSPQHQCIGQKPVETRGCPPQLNTNLGPKSKTLKLYGGYFTVEDCIKAGGESLIFQNKRLCSFHSPGYCMSPWHSYSEYSPVQGYPGLYFEHPYTITQKTVFENKTGCMQSEQKETGFHASYSSLIEKAERCKLWNCFNGSCGNEEMVYAKIIKILCY
jgi:hypothetical protein